jgi:hypothetical protein
MSDPACIDSVVWGMYRKQALLAECQVGAGGHGFTELFDLYGLPGSCFRKSFQFFINKFAFHDKYDL